MYSWGSEAFSRAGCEEEARDVRLISCRIWNAGGSSMICVNSWAMEKSVQYLPSSLVLFEWTKHSVLNSEVTPDMKAEENSVRLLSMFLDIRSKISVPSS